MPKSVNDIAEDIAAQHDLTKAAAKKIVEGIVSNISAAILAGDEVRLQGLGILRVKSTAARTGRNPGTGAAIQIPASRKLSFTASKTIKDALAA